MLPGVAVLLGVLLEERVPAAHRALLLEAVRVVDVNDGVGASRVQEGGLVLRFPFRVPHAQLNFRHGNNLLQTVGVRVPEVDRKILETRKERYREK